MPRLLPRVLVERVPHRLMATAVVLGAMSATANVAIAAVVQAILAHRFSSQGAWIALIAVAVLFVCTTYGSQTVMVRAAFRSLVALRLELAQRVLDLPLAEIEALGTPEVLGVLIGDVQALLVTIFEFPTAIISFCTIVGGFAYLLWLSRVATALLAVVMIVVIGLGMRFQKRTTALFGEARQRESILFEHLSALVQGAKELKLNQAHAAAFVRADLAPTANEVGTFQIRGHMTTVRQRLTVRVGFMLTLAMLLVGPRWTNDAATLSSFILTFFFIVGPIDQFTAWFPTAAKANVLLARIDALAGRQPPKPAPLAAAPLPVGKSIELVQVSRAYRSDTAAGERDFVLGPLDLCVRRGEILFVVGGNGSGKSTLAKLLCGLYWPDRGSIRVDGAVVDEAGQIAYRANFSAIFADFQIFERVPEAVPARMEEARAYLSLLGISARVRIEGDRLVTTGLSHGQRKRLALVRAYLEDRAVYIFDEWAADQDPTWKEIFYRKLLPELRDRGKAVVVISHDDRYFDVADRLIKLDEGQIVAHEARAAAGGAA